jgi:hypothetical protein
MRNDLRHRRRALITWWSGGRAVAVTGLALAMSASCVARRSAELPGAVNVDAAIGVTTPGAVADTVLFAAAVQSIARAHQRTLRVDPRPLRPDSTSRSQDLLAFFSAGTPVADVPQHVVQARSTILNQLGVPQADAVAARRCPGAGNPLPSAEQRKECPGAMLVIAMLGVPRPAAPLAGDSAYVGPGRERGHWIMRGLEIEVDRRSQATIVIDYVLGWRSGRWTVVKREMQVVLE